MSATFLLTIYLLSLPIKIGAVSKTKQGKDFTQTLSEEPRVEYRANFLNASEVSALKKLAEKIGLEAVGETTTTTNGGEDSCLLNRTYAAESYAITADEGWEAADAFANASAAWARLPLRDGAMPVITRWEPWSSGSFLNRSGLLHLDSRLRPRHQTSVIAYLSGVDDSESERGLSDGLTVFPCMETDEMSASEVKRRLKICSSAFRHIRSATEKLLSLRREGEDLPSDRQYAFLEAHPELFNLPKAEDGQQPLQLQWTGAQDKVLTAGVKAIGPLYALAEAMCRGQEPGFRVAPVLGAALLIEGGRPNKRWREVEPDWMLWHTGCSPLEHRGQRWTAQIFLDAVVPPPIKAKSASSSSTPSSPARVDYASQSQNRVEEM